MKKNIILFALAAFFVVPAVFAEKAGAPATPSTELKNFPKAAPEAVYRNVEKIYRFSEDGACDVRTKLELNVNTLFAMNELCGETFIVYNPKFQRVQINEAYTIMADGITRVDLPENARNEVLPKAAADAPDFNFLRELIITHTALEPGATIFLDYTVHYRSIVGRGFDEYPDMPFPCERLFFDFNGATTELFNVPARSREAHFKAEKSIPVIYPGMPAVKAKDFNAEKAMLGIDGKKIVSGVVKETMPHREKIFALQKFVQTKIATVPLAPELLNFKLRSPEEVLASVYGIPAEKAVLLKAMLAEIGEKSFVEVEDEKFFVRTEPYGLLAVVDGESSRADSDFSVRADVKIERGKEIFTGAVRAYPMNVPAEDALARAAEIGFDKKNFSALPEEIDSALLPPFVFAGTRKVARPNAAKALQRSFVFTGTRDVKPNEGIFIWTPPQDKKGLTASGFDKLPTQRVSEFQIDKFFSEYYRYKITLGEGVAFTGTPIEKNISNSVGEFSLKIFRDGNVVSYEKAIALRPFMHPVISVENYPQFRELMTAWFAPESNRVLFIIEDEKAPAVP